MKKKLSFVMSMVMCLSVILGMNVPASAAASWPALSASAYCEFTAAKQINVYKDTACKTRGTSSPAKKYNASIASGDVCYIYKITSSYVQANYPTSSGRRIGYIKRSDFISKSTPTEVVTSKGKATTYASAGGKAYGNVAKGDKVYACGAKDGYTAVIYTAKSGKRAFKFGWVKTSDYTSVVKGESSTVTPVNTQSKTFLADVAKNEIGYQGTGKNGKGTGDYTKYGEWMGMNGKQWCASFVSWCVNRAGVSTKVVPKTADCDTMESKSNSYHKWNKDALKSIKKNDVIFFAKTSHLSDANHVGIVTNVNTSKKTITVVEGNTGPYYGPDIVKEITYTVDAATGKIIKGYNGYSFCGYISVN